MKNETDARHFNVKNKMHQIFWIPQKSKSKWSYKRQESLFCFCLLLVIVLGIMWFNGEDSAGKARNVCSRVVWINFIVSSGLMETVSASHYCKHNLCHVNSRKDLLEWTHRGDYISIFQTLMLVIFSRKFSKENLKSCQLWG